MVTVYLGGKGCDKLINVSCADKLNPKQKIFNGLNYAHLQTSKGANQDE